MPSFLLTPARWGLPSRRAWLAAAAAVLLAACGTADDSGKAHLRLLNASPGYSSLDLRVDDDALSTAVATGAAGDYVSVDTDSHTLALRRSGTATNLVSQDRKLSKNTSYTLVAYGWEGSLKTALMTDDEDNPSSGLTKVRVFNTAADAGTLDVYLTDASTALADTSPVASDLAASSFSSYTELTSGSAWRLRVTGAGDSADLRLDLSGLTLPSGQVVTLMVTPSSGGVLVHALLLPQGGDPATLSNTQARVRLVAGATGNATHVATVAGTTITGSGGVKSPSITGYKLVTAGSGTTLNLVVNGAALATTSVDLTGGSDVSLLVHGNGSAPELAVLTDDNRLPTSSTQAKLRLVNGVYNLGATLTLSLDYEALADGVAAGSASSYDTATASTGSLLAVTSPLSATSLYELSDLTILAKGVYSVFLLGDGGAPTGILRKDR